LLPRSKQEPEQIHVCYRAANKNRNKFMFATAQQIRTETNSCLLPRSKRKSEIVPATGQYIRKSKRRIIIRIQIIDESNPEGHVYIYLACARKQTKT
jgi:hypothetical protein